MSPLSGLKTPNQSVKPNPSFLQGVLEGLADGILILTRDGKWVHSNYVAHRICQQLNQGEPLAKTVPQAIWRVCQGLIDSLGVFPGHPVTIESEITLNRSHVFRVRARWLELDDAQQPYLVVMLEDCHQSLQSQAIAEAHQYELTPRQTDIWRLRRVGLSYEEIASELWIAKNTVKKHLKDIYAKRQAMLEQEE